MIDANIKKIIVGIKNNNNIPASVRQQLSYRQGKILYRQTCRNVGDQLLPRFIWLCPNGNFQQKHPDLTPFPKRYSENKGIQTDASWVSLELAI